MTRMPTIELSISKLQLLLFRADIISTLRASELVQRTWQVPLSNTRRRYRDEAAMAHTDA